MGIPENIKKLRQVYGISQVQLAEIAGVTDKAVSTWENGINEPRMGAIQKISSHFGLLKSALIEENGVEHAMSANYVPFDHPSILPIKTKKIPLLGDIACGEPIVANQEYDSYVMVGVGVQADFAVRAKGDSMINARICDGDIVFVKKQPMVANGEVAVVIINDEVTLKRFRQINKDIVMLLPDNPSYQPITINLKENENVRILGKAVAFQSDVR